MSEQIYILDGHYLIYRAYHAMSNAELQDSQGRPTGAVFGFLRMVLSVLDEHEPDYLICAMDSEEPTFRHEFYEEYKADRPEMPDELRAQIPVIRELLESIEIPVAIEPGYECDDLIASMVDDWADDYDITIVSNDKDNFQLVGENVRILKINQGFTDVEFLDEEGVEEELGVPPEQVPDYLALVGDKIDNVPGVDGIGPTYASRLLDEFDTVEAMLDREDTIEDVVSERLTNAILDTREQLADSKHLVVLKRDAEPSFELEAAKFDGIPLEKTVAFCREYDFNSIREDLEERMDEVPGWAELDVPYEVVTAEQLDPAECPEGTPTYLYTATVPRDQKPMAVETFHLVMTDGKEGLIIPVDLSEEEQVQGFDELMDFLADRELITHDQKKLQLYCLRAGIQPPASEAMTDLQLVSYLVDADEDHGLDDLIARVLETTVPDGPDEDEADAARHAWWMRRAVCLEPLAERLEEQLRERKQSEVMRTIEAPLTRILARMEINGIAIDRDHLEALSEELGGTLEALRERAHEQAGTEFNLNSPKQMREVLFDKLDLPVQGKTGSGKPSTDADTLEALRDEHPIAETILEYRRLNKIESTYLSPLVEAVNPDTGRLHTEFNQTVAATGRLSSSRPNLQNIPVRDEFGRRVREAFVAGGEDRVLVAADYSQIELRLLAHISGDEKLSEAFNEGRDIHSTTAADLFDKKVEAVEEGDRRVAKVVNYGITYGLSAYGLSNDLDISQSEAQDYIDRYFERYPGVEAYIDRTVERAKEQGYVETLFGRRRYIDNLNSGNFHQQQFAERAAVNAPIQGTAADLMKLAMIEFDPQLEPLEAELLLQVHDELVLEADVSAKAEVVSTLEDAMTDVIDLSVPITVSVKTGDNWAEVSK